MYPSSEMGLGLKEHDGLCNTVDTLDTTWGQSSPRGSRGSLYSGRRKGCCCCNSASRGCHFHRSPGTSSGFPKESKNKPLAGVFVVTPWDHAILSSWLGCCPVRSAIKRSFVSHQALNGQRTPAWQMHMARQASSPMSIESEEAMTKYSSAFTQPQLHGGVGVSLRGYESHHASGEYKDQLHIPIGLAASPYLVELLSLSREVPGVIPAQRLNSFGGITGTEAQVRDIAPDLRRTLQGLLFHRAQSILSPSVVHVLSHVLRLERTGPLAEDERIFLRLLTSLLNEKPSSPPECMCFIRLLKKRTFETVSKNEDEKLKFLLTKALANSLNCAQQQHLLSVQQEKGIAVFVPWRLGRLYRILSEQGEVNDDHYKIELQAIVEEQLRHHCSLPQQLAIHSLLFLEPLPSLSAEQRQLLEVLQVQPARWWSTEQDIKYWKCKDQRQPSRTADCSVGEAVQLLLQLMAATLTSSQIKHLTATVGKSEALGSTPALQQPAASSGGDLLGPTASLTRLMAFARQSLQRVKLTPAENRKLQDDILQALVRLVPEEQLILLQSLIHAKGQIPANVQILTELKHCHEVSKDAPEVPLFTGQLDSSELRNAFMHCLAHSLSREQVELLNQMVNQENHKLQMQVTHSTQQVSGQLSAEDKTSGAGWAGEKVGILLDDQRGNTEVPSTSRNPKEVRAALQTLFSSGLTPAQAEFLEYLLRLRHARCPTTKEDGLLTELFEQWCTGGPLSHQQRQLVHQLLLRHLSTSFSDQQVSLIQRLLSKHRSAAWMSNTQSLTGVLPSDPVSLTSEEREVCDFSRDSLAVLTANQKLLFKWMVEGHNCKDSQLAQFAIWPKRDTSEKINVPMHTLLNRLSNSLSPEQLDVMSRLLSQNRTDGGQAAQATEGEKKMLFCAGKDTGEKTFGLWSTTKKSSVGPPAKASELADFLEPECPVYEQGKTTDLPMPGRGGDTRGPGMQTGELQEELTTLLRGLQAGTVTGVASSRLQALQPHQDDDKASLRSLSEAKGWASDLKVPPHAESVGPTDVDPAGDSGSGGGVDAPQLTNLTAKSLASTHPEDLEKKRQLVQRLALEAAERKAFLEDLITWRTQFKQRAQLRKVLREAYIHALPPAYWLASEQQDLREAEERQANLRLLNSLGSRGWEPQDITLSRNAASLRCNASADKTISGVQSSPMLRTIVSISTDLASEKPQDGANYSLGGCTREGSVARVDDPTSGSVLGGMANAQLAYPMASVMRSPFRIESLPRSLPSDHNRTEPQLALERRSDSTGSSPAPTHSLGGAPLLTNEGPGSMSRLAVTSIPGRTTTSLCSHPEGSRGEQEAAMDGRKNIMQRQAIEKAEQLKQDAKVAAWIALTKQQPGESAVGLELASNINLSHLDEKSSPKGKAAQTRSLLRMVEGITTLVCTLPRGEEASSTLASLLRMASQSRVEDCDLAIHAEVENVRKALFRLRSSTELCSGREQVKSRDVPVAESEACTAQQRGKCDGETGGAAGEPSAATEQRTPSPPKGPVHCAKGGKAKAKTSGDKMKPKGSCALHPKSKQADSVGKVKQITKTRTTTPSTPKQEEGPTPRTKTPPLLGEGKGVRTKTTTSSPLKETSHTGKALECPKISIGSQSLQKNPNEISRRLVEPSIAASDERRSPKESPSKVLRIRRRTELVTAMEKTAKRILRQEQRQRTEHIRERYARSSSAMDIQGISDADDCLYSPRAVLRRWATNVDYTETCGEPYTSRKNRTVQQNFHCLEESLKIPPNVPFVILREKLKCWLISEGKGLELQKGIKMRYNDWLAHYYGGKNDRDRSPSEMSSPPPRRKTNPAPKLAMRMQRWSVLAQPHEKQRESNPNNESP